MKPLTIVITIEEALRDRRQRDRNMRAAGLGSYMCEREREANSHPPRLIDVELPL